MVYEYFITSQVINLYFILQILGIFGIHEFVIIRREGYERAHAVQARRPAATAAGGGPGANLLWAAAHPASSNVGGSAVATWLSWRYRWCLKLRVEAAVAHQDRLCAAGPLLAECSRRYNKKQQMMAHAAAAAANFASPFPPTPGAGAWRRGRRLRSWCM